MANLQLRSSHLRRDLHESSGLRSWLELLCVSLLGHCRGAIMADQMADQLLVSLSEMVAPFLAVLSLS